MILGADHFFPGLDPCEAAVIGGVSDTGMAKVDRDEPLEREIVACAVDHGWFDAAAGWEFLEFWLGAPPQLPRDEPCAVKHSGLRTAQPVTGRAGLPAQISWTLVVRASA